MMTYVYEITVRTPDLLNAKDQQLLETVIAEHLDIQVEGTPGESVSVLFIDDEEISLDN